MFRQVSRVALVVLAVGSLAVTNADEPKEPGGKKQITNSLGMTLIYCPSGSFTMGSPADENDRFPNEAQVSVTISKGFYLGKTSVTQAQFKAVMGATPWSGKDYVKEGDDYPATWVYWNDAAEFCRKLTARESQACRLPQGYVYALPTEAQREYACRAGTITAYSFGNDPSALGDHAWWGGMIGNGNCQTEHYAHRVGQKKPNPWGFCDLHGNVYEWCRGYYAATLPGGTDPLVASGSDRVSRGGSWGNRARNCRSADRSYGGAGGRGSDLGFRVALIPADKVLTTAEPTPVQTKQITNSIGIKLTLIPSGEFMMGSSESAEATAAFFNKTYGVDLLNADSFKRRASCSIVCESRSRSTWARTTSRGASSGSSSRTRGTRPTRRRERNRGPMAGTPTRRRSVSTRSIRGGTPGFEQTDEHPVVNVSWNDAVAFCEWLSEKESKTYRLPDRGRVGIRLPCRNDDAVLQRRRSRNAGQGWQRGRCDAQGEIPGSEIHDQSQRRLRVHGSRGKVQAQCLRALRYARKCLAVVRGLVRRGILRHIPRRQPNRPNFRQ